MVRVLLYCIPVKVGGVEQRLYQTLTVYDPVFGNMDTSQIQKGCVQIHQGSKLMRDLKRDSLLPSGTEINFLKTAITVSDIEYIVFCVQVVYRYCVLRYHSQ